MFLDVEAPTHHRWKFLGWPSESCDHPTHFIDVRLGGLVALVAALKRIEQYFPFLPGSLPVVDPVFGAARAVLERPLFWKVDGAHVDLRAVVQLRPPVDLPAGRSHCLIYH